jgi:protoheme IX farnesyltransferase
MTAGAIAISLRKAGEGRRWLDFLALTKPRVILMVLVTTSVGFHLASVGAPDPLLFLHTVFGTALAAAGVMTLNQFLERDVDARMARTCSCPMPDGRIQPGEALIFGATLAAAGLSYLAIIVNWPSTLVAAITAVSYLFVYTPLKRWSPLCILVGAVPGALPPVIGWVAARGEFGFPAWVLFAILFLWQLPHTLSIALLYRADYDCAGLHVLPHGQSGRECAARQTVASCTALMAVGLLPSLLGMTGSLYLLGASLLGAGLLACGVGLALSESTTDIRRLMVATLVYLPALFALLAIDKLQP